MYRIKDFEQLKKVTSDWDNNFVKICLEGRFGEVFAPSKTAPDSAMFRVNEIVLFGGVPDRELVAFCPPTYKTDFALMSAKDDDEGWYSLIEEVYGERATRITRYATEIDSLDDFDCKLLESVAADLPEGYETVPIDEALYNYCRGDSDFSDFVSQYPTWEEFRDRAVGFICLYHGEPASGISTFADYEGTIELELATKPAHRRRGLAAAVSARIVLECISRGLYPSWDAANVASLNLAYRFGYHLDHEYTAYEIEGYKSAK
ncbi:MAG: GNAT family N-acetyltransferase [Clostridia bacterium]|nr:GNAT family N-acetyltransferase [Clostridia bacterium]